MAIQDEAVGVLPPYCKVLKAPHKIPNLSDPNCLPWELGVVSSAKKDGNRGLCVAGQLFTASMEVPSNEHLWPFLNNMINYAAEHQLVFDYELYDPQQEHHAVTSGTLNSYESPLPETLGCYVFDCMELADFVGSSVYTDYELRLMRLRDEIDRIGDPSILMLEQRPVANVDEVRAYFEQDLAAGDEGSILRTLRIDGPIEPGFRKLRGGWYKHGRATVNQGIIFKLKNYVSVDGIIVGVDQRMEMIENAPRSVNASGQLRRPPKAYMRPTDAVGALHVRFRDEKGRLCESRINFGSGFSIMERQIMWTEHLKGRVVGRWCEFTHMPHGAKRDGGARIGQFMRFRDDKGGDLL